MRDDKHVRLFLLGRVVATQGAMAVTTDEERQTFLTRHQIGSWEQTSEESRAENMLALFHGLRIITQHKTGSGNTVWIITESDRSYTTILTPEEY